MSSAVQQLVESSVRFPLAMLAFGVSQGTRVLTEGPGATRQAEASFYRVSQAAEREFSNILLGGFQIGDAIQRDIVDRVFGILWPAPRGAPAASLCLAVQELRNKVQVYDLVRQAKGLLHEPNTGQLPLASLIDRAYSLPVFERIWAVEGLGHDYTATFLHQGRPVHGVLTSGQAEALPSKALTMMHAGMGLAFAEHLWDGISPYDSEARVGEAIERFERLCVENSRDGYTGAARESLGLVTRTLEPLMVDAADRAIRATAPELDSFFWHGAGRALYFAPTHFVPGLTSPWPGILKAAPHRVGVFNLIAGLAWATAVVNMRQPQILADLAARLDAAVLDTGAFANGVSSTLMMAYDIEPTNPWIETFLSYVPEEKCVAARWNAFVREPCRYALERVYPELKSQGKLEELFHYVPAGRD